MKRCLHLALFVALVVASPFAHAVSISGNIFPVATVAATGDFGPNEIAPGTLLDVYQISISTDSSDDLTAFELIFSGSFAQVQNVGLGGSVPTPLLGDVLGFGAVAVGQDTHLVPALALPGAPELPPSEPANTGGAGAFTGFGEGLVSHKVGISASDQAPTVLIAQIVMLANDVGSFSGTVAVAGNSDPIQVGGPIGVPEPGTILLAGLSIIGMVASRRRLA